MISARVRYAETHKMMATFVYRRPEQTPYVYGQYGVRLMIPTEKCCNGNQRGCTRASVGCRQRALRLHQSGEWAILPDVYRLIEYCMAYQESLYTPRTCSDGWVRLMIPTDCADSLRTYDRT
jgi:hypothetical protein